MSKSIIGNIRSVKDPLYLLSLFILHNKVQSIAEFSFVILTAVLEPVLAGTTALPETTVTRRVEQVALRETLER